ncbi:hypothetical protein HMPREF1633_01645 [Tissierellia bacterium S5-A11]|nr:hypothetical protein HMPREF1633_01645 [Tissierellia bacterium S5-A11]
MNRVYKVIYNKGKNSCSVVSEMAKNRGKVSSCRNKVVLAAMVLSLLSVDGLAYVEDPATPAPEPDNGIHYFSVNANDSAKPEGTNWNNDGAKGVAAVAVGPYAGAQGDYGTAVGSYAQAGGVQASAFGVAANASGTAATAAGTNAVAGGASAAAFGASAKAGGDTATAVGTNANAAGTASSAFGFRAQAKSNESVAVGAYTEAENHAAAIGPQAKALSEQSVAVGGKAEAQAAFSLAVGSLASVTQKGGVALGASSLADRQARVWGFDAFAGKAMNEDTLLGEKKAERAQEIDKLNGLGGELKQLRTDLAESIKKDPVGQDGKRIPSDETKQIQENLKNKTDEYNAQFKLVNGYVNAWQSNYGAVSVGNAEVGVTRQITGVAAGTEDTDVVNVAQLKKLAGNVNEQMTGLDTRITTNTENIKTNTENITVLNGRVDQLDTRVDRIGAGAAALAGLHPLDYDPENKWDFAASYGNYNGANAIAIGAFYRPTENRMFSVGGSFGGGENMLNVGFSMKVGQGTGISTSKIAMANEIRDLKTANERMQQENKFMQQENKEMKNEIEILKQQVQQLMATK